jgi:hypothetical protein
MSTTGGPRFTTGSDSLAGGVDMRRRAGTPLGLFEGTPASTGWALCHP